MRVRGSAALVVALMLFGVPSVGLADAVVPGFGPSSFSFLATGSDGLSVVQAGGHPYEVTSRIDFNSELRVGPDGNFEDTSVQDVKDLVIDLPLGFLADAVSTPQCGFAQLSGGHCPAAAVVGHLLTEPSGSGSVDGAIYNMVPEHGIAAEFGYVDTLGGTHALYAGVVPTSAGYVLRVTALDIPQVALTEFAVTLFGDPAARDGTESTPLALLTAPSDCSGQPLTSTVHTDSWQDPGNYNTDGTPNLEDPAWVSASAPTYPEGVAGCGQLRFNPTLALAPEAEHVQADEPAGYEAVAEVPQEEDPGGLATPPLENAVLTLPAGVSISPPAAEGLVGCRESGAEAIELDSPAAGHCPGASTWGEAEVLTPLFGEPLRGKLYVAQPTCGGAGEPECSEQAAETGELFALYVEVGSEERGVHLKLKGRVEVGGNGQHSREVGLQPGQLRVTIAEVPQQPLSELRLKFDGGPRAPLANPQACGPFTTTSELEPWSHQPAPGEAEGTPTGTPSSSFTITGCEPKFAPALVAGTVNLQAGAYSPLILTLSRQDREQDLAGLTFTTPPGLLANLSSVPLCAEPQAREGDCSAASDVGTATVAAGAGADPLPLSGNVYLTGPTEGRPFGLSIVVPAEVGPFHLGDVIIRASIAINPTTAALTIAIDPGGIGIPAMLDGIPLRLRRFNVTLDRSGFIFNPTNCSPLEVTGTLTSSQRANAAVSSRFQVGDCAGLGFKPRLEASTSGKTSRQNGAGLRVKLVYPKAPLGQSGIGRQANLAAVKVDLPKRLVSRLATLQGACLAGVFVSNPAACPATSKVGTASVSTPVLPVAPSGRDATPPGREANLTGPAIFVSHGGKRFPELILVLQADGVTVDLHGETSINAAGVTSSTFRTIPDVPVEAFELNLPEASNSALAANGKLCQTVTVAKRVKVHVHGHVRTVTRKVKKQLGLVMPTALTAHNGAVIHQNTPISITGCPPIRRKAGARKARRAARPR
jgi:hypothetical protein